MVWEEISSITQTLQSRELRYITLAKIFLRPGTPPPYIPTRRLRCLDPHIFGARYSAPRFAPVVQSRKSLNDTMVDWLPQMGIG